MAADGEYHRPLLCAEGFLMRTLNAWAARIVTFLRGNSDREFDEELESHLQLHLDDNIRSGMSPADARRHAVIRLGGVQGIRDRHRDRRGLPAVQHLWRDLQYAGRTLRRQRTFTLVTVLTLALGIGANTSIFTLVDAVLLDPLPYPEPGRLVMIWGTDASGGGRETSISYPDFETWRQEARSFERIAAFTSRPVILGSGDQPELVPAVQTTTDFFRVLGVEPIAGRTFAEGDAAPDTDPVAVVSDASRGLFGGQADVVGRSIRVNNKLHTIIGVVP